MEIKEVKERLGIDEVVRHYGHTPTKTGMMVCAFCGNHEKPKARKTMQVYLDTNRFSCFHPNCEKEFGRKDGDIFDFIERTEKCDKHTSIKIAKKILGVPACSSDRAEPLQIKKEVRNLSDARPEKVKPLESKEGQDLRPSTSTVFVTENPSLLYYKTGALEIEVLGGINVFSGLDRLKVTLKLRKDTHALRHSLDLYYDDQVQKLIRKASERLELSTTIANKALYELTDLLETYRVEERKRLTEKKKLPPLTVSEQSKAIKFLKGKDLIKVTSDALGKSGIVGEAGNRLILFLVYASRKRRNPLHAICLSASGTGKTYLQDKVSDLVPEDEKVSFTASTENAFYYMKEDELRHKLVLIEDLDGAENMLYSLRELQTKQKISKIVPLKDQTGHEINTKTLTVKGPICLSSTTTKERIYEDNANRCLLLYLDNGAAQDKAIMDYQRAHSAGLVNEIEEQESKDLLTHVQRVLKEVKVINPYAMQLQIPERCLKPLRTNSHYLEFIETVTYFHQFQRTKKVNEDTGEEFIETTLEDIKVANELLKSILLDKSDELTKAQRNFFETLKHWSREEKKQSFYAKEYREETRLPKMKVNRYFNTLEDYGLLKRIGGNRKVGFEYEVTNWEDYNHLKTGLSILDTLLSDLV